MTSTAHGNISFTGAYQAGGIAYRLRAGGASGDGRTLQRVEFSYAGPRHVEDYAFLYPGEVGFNVGMNSIFLLTRIARPRSNTRSTSYGHS